MRTQLKPPPKQPSIYVGETSRCLYERGKEHWRGFENKSEDSHIYKHHQIHHGGEGSPSFHLRAIGYMRTALSRQIAEAVRIQHWGEDIVLNSKTEFNRCRIGRLTLGENNEKPSREQQVTETEELIDKLGTQEWERTKTHTRRVAEIQGEFNIERGLAKSPPTKRLMTGAENNDSGRKNKRTGVKKMSKAPHHRQALLKTPEYSQ